MARETRSERDEEPVPPAPEVKPRFTLIVVLSILLGVMLTLNIIGIIYHFQSRKGVEAALATAIEDARQKTLLLTGMQDQVAGLSKQIHALKDFSVARARAVAEEVSTTGKLEQPAHTAAPVPVEAPIVIAKPNVRKTPPGEMDCQLVGKSAEDRAETLKRCAAAMDGRR
jgi:hypothetical protein